MTVGVAHAPADNRITRALVFGLRCGDGNTAGFRNGHSIIRGPDGILSDQHLDRRGRCVGRCIFHGRPQRIEFFRTDLADELGQIEQHQLGVLGNIREGAVPHAVLPFAILPVIFDRRNMRGASNGHPRRRIQRGMVVHIVLIRGQHIADLAVHLVGKVRVDCPGQVIARGDAHGTLPALKLPRAILGLALGDSCLYGIADAAVGKGNLIIGIHMLDCAK